MSCQLNLGRHSKAPEYSRQHPLVLLYAIPALVDHLILHIYECTLCRLTPRLMGAARSAVSLIERIVTVAHPGSLRVILAT